MSNQSFIKMSNAVKPWQNSLSSTPDALRHMLQKEYKADVSVGHDRLAHKLVLSLWSPVLADIFMQKDSKVLEVQLSPCPRVTDIILQYMYDVKYKDAIQSLPKSLLVKLYDAATRYSLRGLCKRCVKHVQTIGVSPSNVVYALDVALHMHVWSMVKKCKDVIGENGITTRCLEPSTSLEAVLELLKVQKVAADGEANLLRLVVSWLSHPTNFPHKYSVLPLLDLAAIDWNDYKQIVRDYPYFFPESELAKILMCVAQGRSDELVQFFGTRTTTEVEHGCSACTSTRLAVSSFLWSELRATKVHPDDIIQVDLVFTVFKSTEVRLMGFELGFGPREVPEDGFTVKLNVAPRWHADPFKKDDPTYVEVVQSGRAHSYVVCLATPAVMKTDDRLLISFQLDATRSPEFEVAKMKPVPKLKKLAPFVKGPGFKLKLESKTFPAFFVHDAGPKLLISSINFFVCEKHWRYLHRKVSEAQKNPQAADSPTKKFKHFHFNEEAIPVVKVKIEE